MEKKYQVLYIWSFIIVAGIILLLLYTPIGGSLHQSNDISYYSYNTSVDFGGKISNSPRINASQSNVPSEEEIKNSLDMPKFGASNPRRSRINSNNLGADYSANITTTPDMQGGAAAGGGLSTPVFGSRGGRGNGAGSFTGGMAVNHPFATETNNTPSTMQKGSQDDSNDNRSDPGGDPDDDDHIIPIGDGFPVLLMFALIYFIYKRTLVRG